MKNPQYMDDEMPEMPEPETNPPDDVKPAPPPRGIGNWNFLQLARMSKNPNTRRNSSRT